MRQNKQQKQIEAKKRHLESLKQSRRVAPALERPEPMLSEKPTILIVCEGENTEPSYFRQFRLSSATIKPIGEGYNTVSLVNRAEYLARQGQYEQVWCVFDKDDFSNEDFNNAITNAERNGFGVAYSNQAFEFWLILHFNDHQGAAMHRKDYDDKINTEINPLGATYDGKESKIISEDFFELMEIADPKTGVSRRQLAIDRAKRIHENLDHFSPATEESSTTVFRLVEEIMKYV